MTQVEKNKQLVTTAYQRIFGDLDSTGIDEFMSKDFIQTGLVNTMFMLGRTDHTNA